MSDVSEITQIVNLSDRKWIDRSNPPNGQDGRRELYQGSAYRINLEFRAGEAVKDATGHDFSLRVQNAAGAEIFTNAGTWTTQTQGKGYVDISAADLNFSGAGYTAIAIYNGSKCADWPLEVLASGTPAPNPGTVIDWADYTGYSNTADNGPYTAGTGITFGTADSEGRVPIQAGQTRKYKVESGSFTALPETLHIVVATSTATDFTPPVEGQGYSVLVWNGMATVGGTAYAVKGTLIVRRYHSGAWTQKVYFDNAQTINTTGDQVKNGVLTFAMNPKVTGIQAINADGISLIDDTGSTVFSMLSTSTRSHQNHTPRTDGGASLGTSSLKWLAGYISKLFTGAVQALTFGGLALKDSAGTTHATVDSAGLALNQLTASRPLSLDANKRAVTLSAADFRTLIEAAKKTPDINAQTGTTYTLVLTDAGKIVTMANAAANTLTIPTNASVAYAVGTIINVIQKGAGTTTIGGATGVTVNGVSAGSGDITAQWQGVALTKVATDEWIVSGAIGTVA